MAESTSTTNHPYTPVRSLQHTIPYRILRTAMTKINSDTFRSAKCSQGTPSGKRQGNSIWLPNARYLLNISIINYAFVEHPAQKVPGEGRGVFFLVSMSFVVCDQVALPRNEWKTFDTRYYRQNDRPALINRLLARCPSIFYWQIILL